MPNRPETTTELDVKEQKACAEKYNKTIKGKLLKIYFYLFYSLHQTDVISK